MDEGSHQVDHLDGDWYRVKQVEFFSWPFWW